MLHLLRVTEFITHICTRCSYMFTICMGWSFSPYSVWLFSFLFCPQKTIVFSWWSMELSIEFPVLAMTSNNLLHRIQRHGCATLYWVHFCCQTNKFWLQIFFFLSAGGSRSKTPSANFILSSVRGPEDSILFLLCPYVEEDKWSVSLTAASSLFRNIPE